MAARKILSRDDGRGRLKLHVSFIKPRLVFTVCANFGVNKPLSPVFYFSASRAALLVVSLCRRSVGTEKSQASFKRPLFTLGSAREPGFPGTSLAWGRGGSPGPRFGARPDMEALHVRPDAGQKGGASERHAPPSQPRGFTAGSASPGSEGESHSAALEGISFPG